jgi:hypothetical protein
VEAKLAGVDEREEIASKKRDEGGTREDEAKGYRGGSFAVI